jgi:glutamyl-Q tRNA(Asp) synthetase
LIRIENIDEPRERRGAAAKQIGQLERYGMIADEPAVFQSDRSAAYELALQKLRAAGLTYYCRCSRSQLARAQPKAKHHVYAGYCRQLGLGPPGAVRLRVDGAMVGFTDRAFGWFCQDVGSAVGDFVLRRSDRLWAYQLAVVVDDAEQGVTDVVRGADLLDNTPRQILLQRALGLPTPRYLHVPLVLDATGRKLSKQDQDQALGSRDALDELEQAWQHLGFAPSGASTVHGFQSVAVAHWRQRFCVAPSGAAHEEFATAASAPVAAPERS